MEKIIGAEAAIRTKGEAVEKERIKKSYRIKEIDDRLRERRTRSEAKLIREARRRGVLTPRIFSEDKYTILMENIRGTKLRDFITKKNHKIVARKIADYIGILHGYNIIHGDLTTSNMIAKSKAKAQVGKKNPRRSSDFDLYFIDFGLGFFSHRPEDKATDLHLLREALVSTHFDVADSMWKIVMDEYKKSAGSEKVISTLAKIEKRGRYVERKKK